MKEIFKYKAKHILYNTGEIIDTVEEPEPAPAEGTVGADSELTKEQMSVVLGSMSDNRITDSVKDLVDQATDPNAEPLLTEEQRSVVLGSMSDNRSTDSVKDLVDQATDAE